MAYSDCIVIGGGAAGLMCAAQVGYRGKSVILLDHANKVGKKILMSGGGRCNFTNYFVEPSNYISNNSHFCKSALSRFTQYDFLAMVNKYHIPFHEKTLGQLFCNNKANDILNMLTNECDAAGATIHTECSIEQIKNLGEALAPARFELTTTQGTMTCQSLVVATGGLSIPTMGATGFGYDIAKQFGLNVTPLHPSLVPFTFKGCALKNMQAMAGLSLPIIAECRGQTFKEALLFTHRGISGPAILQVSNYWWPGDVITLNFLPDKDVNRLLGLWQEAGEKAALKNLLARELPKRFVQEWLGNNPELQALLELTVAQLSNAQKFALANGIHRAELAPTGTEGNRTAEVTRGGINTDEVSSKTFEANKVPGLFFIGEVLDVTGWLGGFNFQWAWASGYCAAQFV